jgi:seryl-tRNA synthetase
VLSLQLIREQPDAVKAAIARRHEDATAVDRILALDERRRQLLTESETLRARRNEVSRQIGAVARTDPGRVEAVRAEMRQVGEQIAQLEKTLAEVEQELQARALDLPNTPYDSVPDGASEDDFEIVGTWGTPRELPFPAGVHWDFGPALGLIDFERGVKLSGTRFYLLRGPAANLQRGLIQWMLDVHTREHGYLEVQVPYLLKPEAMVWAAQLPKFADNLFHDDESGLWLIPTAESALAGIYANEILEPGALPVRMVGYTACFRKEKMASGKDTRGIKRGFQFDKVELFQIVEPGADLAALDEMVEQATVLLRRLDLPYRVKALCAADIAFQSAKTFDLEVWSPGVGEWLEVSSCSTVRDFQARRANLRFRREPGGRPEFPYELNASGLALPRLMIALLENFQQPDGSIAVPDVLRPYMGGLSAIQPIA